MCDIEAKTPACMLCISDFLPDGGLRGQWCGHRLLLWWWGGFPTKKEESFSRPEVCVCEMLNKHLHLYLKCLLCWLQYLQCLEKHELFYETGFQISLSTAKVNTECGWESVLCTALEDAHRLTKPLNLTFIHVMCYEQAIMAPITGTTATTHKVYYLCEFELLRH